MTPDQMISTLGFPIACVVALGWYIVTIQAKLMETIAKNTEAINDLRDAIAVSRAMNEKEDTHGY